MKYAIVAFLALASTAASVTVAQDGSGTGPPKQSVVFTSQAPAPTATKAPAPTVSRLKLH